VVSTAGAAAADAVVRGVLCPRGRRLLHSTGSFLVCTGCGAAKVFRLCVWLAMLHELPLATQNLHGAERYDKEITKHTLFMKTKSAKRGGILDVRFTPFD
jgi:hypothetical protein